MPTLTFPDGNTRSYEAAITGRAIVEGIAKSLAKRTVAMALDGTVRDLDDLVEQDARIEFLDRTDPRSLELNPARLRPRAGRGGAGPVARARRSPSGR